MAEDREVRDKLITQGVEALTDAELISVLLQDAGGPHQTVNTAQKLLDSSGGNLKQLSRMDIRRLRMAEGLGIKRAALLTAAFELGRRCRGCDGESPVVIGNNEDVIKIFRPQIASLPHEEFWVLFLSSANTVIGKTRVSQGGVSGTVVDHRLIVKRAVELLSSGIILVHNHPSGVAIPSDEDRSLTEKIREAAGLFDISILDHMIITSGECFSFRQMGFL